MSELPDVPTQLPLKAPNAGVFPLRSSSRSSSSSPTSNPIPPPSSSLRPHTHHSVSVASPCSHLTCHLLECNTHTCEPTLAHTHTHTHTYTHKQAHGDSCQSAPGVMATASQRDVVRNEMCPVSGHTALQMIGDWQ